MFQRFIPIVAIVLLLSGSVALADCGCGGPPVYAAAPTYVAGYAPAVAYEAPVTYAASYAPVAYTSYYAAPAPVSYATYYEPAPVYAAPVTYTSYYAPAAPYATYYSPAVVVGPARYRAYYYGVPGVSVFGAPRLYVPGEPVRNTIRAVTP